MEAAIVGGIGRIAPLLYNFLEKEYKLLGELEGDIEFIKTEFEYISAAIEKDGDQPLRSDNKVHKKWIETVRELARAIEDCIDNFTHCVTLESGASFVTRARHKMSTLNTRRDFATKIKKLKQRCVDARQQRDRYITETGDLAKEIIDPMKKSVESSTLEPETLAYTEDPVGMDAAQEELMELIGETPQGQPKEKLKVISLVGFGGIGKSQLAWQVYNSPAIVARYKARAWVRAGEKDVKYALKEILRQLDESEGTKSNSGGSEGTSCHLGGSTSGNEDSLLIKLRARLNQYLGEKRFFIVIDDMRVEFWDDIKGAFPVVPYTSSRVIVTTATQSIATKCSFHDGHVYAMRTLDEEHSRKLFLEKADLKGPPLPPDLEVIKKCDGLPLALVTTARVLYNNPTEKEWADLGKNLGQLLERNNKLASMNRVLVRSYTSLGSLEMKTCLLYLGIYPGDRPIRRGSLIRKWLAEGFINQAFNDRSALEVAVANFDELVDRSIIQPIIDVSSSNSEVVKTCQTHGMMLEFILHKSMCQNFVTLLYDKDPPRGSKIRWLSLHKAGARSKMDPEDLSLVRSLTIFGEAHNSMLDFSKYKLLKVLDLEECRVQMEDSHLRDMCSNLVLLRYLSLGPSVKVTMLPEEIKMLKLLETLDVRRTMIEILPTQVMELPCLVHLFGKIKLQEKGIGGRRIGKLQTWLSENSKLETLAGFVADKRQEMPQLIEHMKHLTKVKIWCESTPDPSKINHLKKAIKGLVERGTDLYTALSLSLNFNTEWHQDLLYLELKKDRLYYLRSLKLQGNKICSSLPLFVTNLYVLTKLCLSFPGDNLSGEIIDALNKVRGLEYLQLVAYQLDNLVIRPGALRSLKSLCIVVEVMTGMEIEKGALPRLDSLQLLCKDLNGFSSTTIQSLPLLKEVVLHDGLSDQTKQEWKQAAKNHPRRPNVLFKLKRKFGANFRSRHAAADTSTAATATDTMAQEVNMESEPTENYAGEFVVPVVTSVIEIEPAANIPEAPATIDNVTPLIQQENHVLIDGHGQHDDRETKYMDSTGDSQNFATENGSSTSTESSEEMEREDQHMEDDTQAHKDDEPVLNKTIKRYHEMATIHDNSHATGQYARSSNYPLEVTSLAAPHDDVTQSHNGDESSAPKPKRAKTNPCGEEGHQAICMDFGEKLAISRNNNVNTDNN